jgi:hypothetical protein
MLDLTTLVIAYVLISAFCTVAIAGACIVSSRPYGVRRIAVRAARPKHHSSILATSAYPR